LDALQAPDTEDWMKALPALGTLRQIWEQQFEPQERGDRWRQQPALPAAQLINSPFDLDARYGKKNSTLWVGNKVHFPQTCDEDAPQLITHVETTRAGINDVRALPSIHARLAQKALLPDQHLVDAGYVGAENLIESRTTYELDLIGPLRQHYWWHAKTDYEISRFSIEWDAQVVTCPHGHRSSSWTPAQDNKGNPVIKVKFSQTDCKACSGCAACTGQVRRTLTLQPQERMQARLSARKREDTEEFKEVYRHRVGIEGVHSQGTRAMGLRRSRSFGFPKTHLAHVAIATAMNLVQLSHWLNGEAPEQTRTSADHSGHEASVLRCSLRLRHQYQKCV
jgi:transposase